MHDVRKVHEQVPAVLEGVIKSANIPMLDELHFVFVLFFHVSFLFAWCFVSWWPLTKYFKPCLPVLGFSEPEESSKWNYFFLQIIFRSLDFLINLYPICNPDQYRLLKPLKILRVHPWPDCFVCKSITALWSIIKIVLKFWRSLVHFWQKKHRYRHCTLFSNAD